jgi:hypothetical protein
MNNTPEIINLLKDLKNYLSEKYKVKEIGIFGSIIREERTETSDIDVLVDFEMGADLLDLVGLGQFLEEKLGCKVDVIPKRALRKEIREYVLQEVVQV